MPSEHPLPVRQVTPAWVRSQGRRLRIVDVRDHDEVAALPALPGASCVPLAVLEQEAARWDREEALVLVCRSGRRSDRGAASLLQMGFCDVASMTGGMLAYEGSPHDA